MESAIKPENIRIKCAANGYIVAVEYSKTDSKGHWDTDVVRYICSDKQAVLDTLSKLLP